ncbi:hypothetical protein GGR08_001010 [Bartonella fuyuanensis]|uniref:Uncharacterized protein n=1 Tax=Bartonella fuyuanensis TaxID=1460968 RepID=A0A840DUB4_9HYPH|nr:hypothetical protein [Bartonella fuyuanensis]
MMVSACFLHKHKNGGVQWLYRYIIHFMVDAVKWDWES